VRTGRPVRAPSRARPGAGDRPPGALRRERRFRQERLGRPHGRRPDRPARHLARGRPDPRLPRFPGLVRGRQPRHRRNSAGPSRAGASVPVERPRRGRGSRQAVQGARGGRRDGAGETASSGTGIPGGGARARSSERGSPRLRRDRDRVPLRPRRRPGALRGRPRPRLLRQGSGERVADLRPRRPPGPSAPLAGSGRRHDLEKRDPLPRRRALRRPDLLEERPVLAHLASVGERLGPASTRPPARPASRRG
jgi:hypothetical protein